jgi:hypothetical protein
MIARRSLALRILPLVFLSACGSAGHDGNADGGGNDAGTVGVPVDVPGAEPVEVDPNPTSPKADDGTDLGWLPAPLMTGVKAARNRDSAVVVVPDVPGAVDFRVATLPLGTKVYAKDGGEQIDGSTIFCAGYKQRNAPAGPRELLRVIEVAGLNGATRVVVEALSKPCPFAGAVGQTHADVTADNPEIDAPAKGVFSFFTEAEIREKYGSMIFNGHGPSTKPGQPAAAVAPPVLARTAIKLAPLGTTGKAPTATFFEDFGPDPIVFVQAVSDGGRTQNGRLYQNSKFSFYTYGADQSQFFIDRGRLHMVVADWGQDIMASNIAYPRKPVALGENDYLHVTYEVASNSTSRRYWWLHLCGAEIPGATMDAQGKLKGSIIVTPFFMEDDGKNPSVEGWNCLQIFPRQGWPFDLPPGNTRPESEIRVMTNRAGNLGLSNVVNVSPAQYDADVGPPSWFRQRDAQGKLVAPILDDQQLIAPRTRFDVFVSRNRVVLYANGTQRLCNDLGTKGKLTMAEGALGFGQVLYHSAAERQEFDRDFWDRKGQRYYLENTPFVDERTWDNVGYEEHVPLPSNFDAGPCYTPAR